VDENLIKFPDQNELISLHDYYNRMIEAYSWHYRIRNRPASFNELIRFARWQGLTIKEPTKGELVNFFLDNKIVF